MFQWNRECRRRRRGHLGSAVVNFLVAVAFLSFLLGPACVANAAVRERFQFVRGVSRVGVAFARGRWLKRIGPAIREAFAPGSRLRSLPWRAPSSAIYRFALLCLELPPAVWKLAVEHYHGTTMRVAYRPDVGTLSAKLYRGAMVDQGSGPRA